MSDITVFNTEGKSKEVFTPLKPGEVTMYSCGPTVYGYIHLGNFRSFIFADTLKRMFLFNGLEVRHIINITDVGHMTSDADEGEDKMLKGARREKKTVWEVAQFYTESFLKDFTALRNIPPIKFTKATEHIQEMIDMIRLLEKNGCTYVADGNVYMDTSKVPDYGRLFNLNTEEEVRSRVEQDAAKKNKRDFVLWFTKSKFQDQEMKWESPWGVGYPGWHIECSAMATKYLGERIDVHTGGMDLIPIHHTNEIAQAECALHHNNDTHWVQYWMHNEFLLEDDKKASRSDGTLLTMQKLVDEGYAPEDFRYFLLLTHYRKSCNFSFEALKQAKQALDKIKNKVKDLVSDPQEGITETQHALIQKHVDAFTASINDDLNTPKAVAVLWDVLGDQSLSPSAQYSLLLKFDSVFGLGLNEIQADTVPDEIKTLIDERERAREDKQWDVSDKIRDDIQEKGYSIKDTPQGPVVRKTN